MNIDYEALIQPTVVKIQEIVNQEQPKILSQLAKEIFDSAGTTHGRHWDVNTESTAKRKGKNHRNVDTGLLQSTLEQDGFLMQDDYMASLPDKYNHANYSPNKFDDIGRTADDEQYVVDQLAIKIVSELNNA